MAFLAILANYFVARIIFMVVLVVVFKNITHKGIKFLITIYMILLAMTILQTPIISLGYLIDPSGTSPVSMIFISIGTILKSLTIYGPFL